MKQNIGSDIVLKLKVIDGEKPLSSLGMVDKRLFTGDNKLHLKYNHQTHLYYYELDSGVLPQPLKQNFTSMQFAIEFAKDYYARRNVEVYEIIY